jgi:hypothetical protein
MEEISREAEHAQTTARNPIRKDAEERRNLLIEQLLMYPTDTSRMEKYVHEPGFEPRRNVTLKGVQDSQV